MARTKTRAPLRTGGFAWGQSRVDLQMSIRELSRRSKIDRGDLSKMERGRMVPTSDEYDRVMAALTSAREDALEIGAAVQDDAGSGVAPSLRAGASS